MSVEELPKTIKSLFPKENLEFAKSINEEEAKVLKEVFAKHACFNEVGEMIEATEGKSKELADRMRKVLEGNKHRLSGLTPEAIEYSKKVIAMVTHTMCSLTLGKTVDEKEAKDLKTHFKELSEADQLGLQNNNPDIEFV